MALVLSQNQKTLDNQAVLQYNIMIENYIRTVMSDEERINIYGRI